MSLFLFPKCEERGFVEERLFPRAKRLVRLFRSLQKIQMKN